MLYYLWFVTMYRPGGFPEYTPAEQRIFDTIVSILTTHFEKWNYSHILTPAVEPVDILTRGGDIGDKQVYGLYGLAQGNEDTKDYALHFDLTVPFARYVLDHMNDLVFPFKRYQIQPVWRGERTKRGRYKEFRQFDIDTIWRSETEVGSRYDAESIIVCYQSLQEIFGTFAIDRPIIVKISNIGITKRYLSTLEIIDDNQLSVCKLLDDYFKADHETFMKKASTFVDATALQKIETLLLSHDYTLLADIEGFTGLDEIIKNLKKYNVNVQYDLAIIRGHNYYTGTVVEFFLEDDMELGAIAGGGAYRGLTDFINPKHSFSGVGCSISSRIMEVILSLGGSLQNQNDAYMFINFAETFGDTIGLMKLFHDTGKKCEIYPTAAKLGKQFEYADKKGITYCVVYGAGEKEKGTYMIKNMQTSESYEGSFDSSFGIIPICEIDGVKRIAMIKHTAGHRGFPKGHADDGEDALTAAKRECAEEVGLKDIVIDEDNSIQESYFIADPKKAMPITGVAPRNILKTITYFIATVKDPTLKIQPEEVLDAQWLTLSEAKELPMFAQMRGVLDKIGEVLK